MESKRVLRWKQDLNGWWKAVTLNGTWWAHDEGHWRLAGGQWSGQVSDGNLSTAQDLCEFDYIARCSEFLRVAGPGEVVVKVDDLIALLSMHNVGACCGDIDKIVECLTAAIDAAKGVGRMAFEQDFVVTVMTCSGDYRLREYVGDDAYLETKNGESLYIIDRWGRLKDVLPAAPTAKGE